MNRCTTMGYSLHAFLGTRASLGPIAQTFGQARIVELTESLALIPMTHDLFDEIKGTTSSQGILKFELLTEEVEHRILEAIGNQKVAYVESEFFGGSGGHAGILWENGNRVREEAFDGDSMNRILGALGISRMGAKDEFDVTGLGRHRRTQDWYS